MFIWFVYFVCFSDWFLVWLRWFGCLICVWVLRDGFALHGLTCYFRFGDFAFWDCVVYLGCLLVRLACVVVFVTFALWFALHFSVFLLLIWPF